MKNQLKNIKIISMAFALLLTFVFGFSSHAQAAAKTASFDHTQTGYILKDIHLALRCEQCHVDGIFKNTPKNCAGCHAPGTRVAATPQPINHIQTTAACDSCHTSTATFQVKTFNHMSVTGKCASCHNGQTMGVMSKPANHFPTTQPCEQCHTNTSTFLSWQMGPAGHTGITSGCATCHSGQFPGVVSVPAIPTLHVPMNGQDCGNCHGFNNFDVGGFLTPKATYDHSLTTARCDTCHAASSQILGITVVPAVPAHHVPITGTDCNTCHNNLSTFLGAFYDHSTVGVGSCDTCHTGAYPGVMTKGASHIPTLSYKCDSCHTAINTVGYQAFSGSKYHAQVSATAGSCSTCHTGAYAASPELAQGVNSGASGIHIPLSASQSCDQCHTASNTNQFLAFSGAFYHTSVSAPAGGCLTCHNGSYNSGSWTAKGLTSGVSGIHIPTAGASCDACHTAANTAQFTTFLGTTYHASVVASAGSCASCHSGTYTGASWNAQQLTSGVSGIHIPTASASCDVCHTTANTAQFTTFLGTTYHASVVASAGGCAACHSGTYTGASWNAQQLTSGISGIHIPTASASCDVCHTSANTAQFASFLGTTYHASVVATAGGCAACHSGTYAGSSWNAQGINAVLTHIPVTGSQTCDTCHTSANTAQFNNFLGTTYHGSVTATAGGCTTSTCHSGTYTTSGANPVGVTHIPTTSASCDVCHTASNTLQYSVSYNFAGATYHSSVTAVTGTCVNCHAGAYTAAPENALSMASMLALAGTPHMVTGASCETCHTSATTGNYTTFLGAVFDHSTTNFTTNPCASCHNGTSAKGKPLSHLATTLACNSAGCHTSVTTSNYTTFLNGTYHPANPVVAGSCANASCHDGSAAGIAALALGKPAAHPPVVGALTCDSVNGCHSTASPVFSNWAGTQYHPKGDVTGGCAQSNCHTGTLWGTAVAIVANHPLTQTPTLSCDSSSGCHSSVAATAYITWANTMYHPNGASVGNCAGSNCHAGTKLWGTALPIATNHPLTQTPTLSCDSSSGCHSSVAPAYASWANTQYHPNGASVGNCAGSNCHAGTKVWGTALPIATNHPLSQTPTLSCDSASGCHSSVAPAYASWANTQYHPNGASTGNCAGSNCHAGTKVWGTALPTPASHPVSQAPTLSCDSASGCHSTVAPAYASWSNTQYHPSGSVTGGCDQGNCHVAKLWGTALAKPAGHPPVGSITTCDSASGCHSTVTPSYTTWAGTMFHPSGAITGGCNQANCHTGTPLWGSALPTNTGHVSFTGDCVACHTVASTSNYSNWLGAAYAHSASSVGVCDKCHDDVQAKGKSSPHVPATGTCDAAGCHSGATIYSAPNVAVGYPSAWLGATFAPHPASAASTCSSCHGTTTALYPGVSTQAASPGGLVGLLGKPHVVTAAQCDTCHTAAISLYLSANPTWAGAGFDHSTAAVGSCVNSGCHGAGGGGKGLSTNHILTTVSCDSGGCHAKLGGTVTTFAGGMWNHSVAPMSAATCDSCHGGLYASFGTFGAATKVTNHIPITLVPGQLCNGCHTVVAPTTVKPTAGSTAWKQTSYTIMESATGHGGAQGGGAIYCITCHLSGATITYLMPNTSKDMKNHKGASATTDCSSSSCHAPKGKKGTAYSSWGG
jgi:hypothetical protein